MKSLNYRIGAFKRQLGLGRGDFEPGAMISKMNEQKVTTDKELKAMPEKTQTSIKGLV